YMAPEHLRALQGGPVETVDARSDAYAVGLILFELLTRRHPFPAQRGKLHQILPKLLADRLAGPPDARALNPALSPAAPPIRPPRRPPLPRPPRPARRPPPPPGRPAAATRPRAVAARAAGQVGAPPPAADLVHDRRRRRRRAAPGVGRRLRHLGAPGRPQRRGP